MTEALRIDEPAACGLGLGERCCAFLVSGATFQCGRMIAGIEATVRARLIQGSMNAKYDPGATPFPQCQPYAKGKM